MIPVFLDPKYAGRAVLVIDNNVDFKHRAREALQELDPTIGFVPTSSLNDARYILEQHPGDIVLIVIGGALLDSTPRDGMAFVKTLRAKGFTRPILAVSIIFGSEYVHEGCTEEVAPHDLPQAIYEHLNPFSTF